MALVLLLFLLHHATASYNNEPIGCLEWDEGGGLCSGHGVCVTENGTRFWRREIKGTHCECDDGWTGKGHLLNHVKHDCPYNKVGLIIIHAWWAFTCLVHLIKVVEVMKRFFKGAAGEVAKSKKKKGCCAERFPRWTFLWPQRNFQILLISITMASFALIAAILYLANEETLGDEVPCTLAYTIFALLYWTMSVLFNQNWYLSTLRKLPPSKTRHLLAETPELFLRAIIWAQMAVLVALVVVLLATLGLSDNRTSLTITYYIIQPVLALLTTSFLWAVGWSIRRVVKSDLGTLDEDSKELRLNVANDIKLTLFQYGRVATILIVVNLSIVLWPWFRGRIGYIFPVLSSLAVLSHIKGIDTLKMKTRHNRKSMMKAETGPNGRRYAFSVTSKSEGEPGPADEVPDTERQRSIPFKDSSAVTIPASSPSDIQDVSSSQVELAGPVSSIGPSSSRHDHNHNLDAEIDQENDQDQDQDQENDQELAVEASHSSHPRYDSPGDLSSPPRHESPGNVSSPSSSSSPRRTIIIGPVGPHHPQISNLPIPAAPSQPRMSAATVGFLQAENVAIDSPALFNPFADRS